jgi:hypothetical protein
VVQEPVQLLLGYIERGLYFSAFGLAALYNESHPGDESGQKGAGEYREGAHLNPGDGGAR